MIGATDGERKIGCNGEEEVAQLAWASDIGMPSDTKRMTLASDGRCLAVALVTIVSSNELRAVHRAPPGRPSMRRDRVCQGSRRISFSRMLQNWAWDSGLAFISSDLFEVMGDGQGRVMGFVSPTRAHICFNLVLIRALLGTFWQLPEQDALGNSWTPRHGML